MKKSTNYFYLIVLITFASPLLANSNGRSLGEYEEVINKSFSFNTSEPAISLNNSYGDMIIVSSNRPDVSIEIIITVEANSKSRADQIFNKISVEFDDAPSKLKVKTKLENPVGRLTKKNEKFTIDYKVSIPERTLLSLNNKYGDISLTSHNNDVEVELKYGSGSIQSITGDLELHLSYANKFNVGEIKGNLKSKTAYSHLSVDSGQIVDCTSAYSDISFDEIMSIECDSKYDNFIINKVKNINLDDKYSSISIGYVDDIFLDMAYSAVKIRSMSKQGIFDTSYGSVNIRKVENSADKIDIDSGHTGYDIGYDGGLTLDIETEYTNVKYPDDLTISYRDKDNNELTLKGTKKGVGNLNIKASMKYGHLKINS